MSHDVTLFIDPVTYHFERDRLFDTQTIWHGGDTVLEPYRFLREWMHERGVRVHTGDLLERREGMSERNVYLSLGTRHRHRKVAELPGVTMSAFVAMECPAVEPSLYADLHDLSRVFRRMYSFSTGQALRSFLAEPMDFLPFHIPQSWDSVHEDIWAQEQRPGFMAMVNTNKLPRDYRNELYTERLRAIEYFARSGGLDLYGMGWDQAPFQVGVTRVPVQARRLLHIGRSRRLATRPTPALAAARSIYRGPVRDKAGVLGRYRFALVIENMSLQRWITEKLFDCLYAGTVPIYLGAPDVEEWIPSECFIDLRDFEDYAELSEYLRSLGEDEVRDLREAGREFIGSERFRPFSKLAHAELFGRIVEEDAGVDLELPVAA